MPKRRVTILSAGWSHLQPDRSASGANESQSLSGNLRHLLNLDFFRKQFPDSVVDSLTATAIAEGKEALATPCVDGVFIALERLFDRIQNLVLRFSNGTKAIILVIEIACSVYVLTRKKSGSVKLVVSNRALDISALKSA